MKKLLMTFSLAAICMAAAAQNHPYDSLSNFLGDNVERYVGQVLYLKNSNEARGNNGYNNFGIRADFDLGPNGRNVFRSVPSQTPLQYVSNYARMAGHYFKVDGVVTRSTKAFTRGGLTHYLGLTDMATGDKCHMGYQSQNADCFKDVVVVGYYEKMRNTCIGRTYIYTGKEPAAYRSKTYAGLQDMGGKGRRTDIRADSEWKCLDVAIEDGNDYQVIGILENPQHGQVYTPVTDLANTDVKNAKFTTTEDLKNAAGLAAQEDAAKAAQNAARLDEAVKKFGEANGTLLAKGEVKAGMTKEMCRWAFGGPFNVLMVTENGDNVEQWFYTSGRYLYFRGDTLIKHTEVAAYKDDTQYIHKQGAK